MSLVKDWCLENKDFAHTSSTYMPWIQRVIVSSYIYRTQLACKTQRFCSVTTCCISKQLVANIFSSSFIHRWPDLSSSVVCFDVQYFVQEGLKWRSISRTITSVLPILGGRKTSSGRVVDDALVVYFPGLCHGEGKWAAVTCTCRFLPSFRRSCTWRCNTSGICTDNVRVFGSPEM